MAGPPKKPIPSRAELLAVYPRLNMSEAAATFGVKQTLFHKWLKERGIERTKKPRSPRTEEHKKNLGDANKGRSQKRDENFLICPNCLNEIYRRPSAQKVSIGNFCSQACANAGKYKTFEGKICPQCGIEFNRRPTQTTQNFRRQVYCSIDCSSEANPPPILKGSENPNWKGDEARRRHRHGPTSTWRRAVLARDNATCQHCGTQEGALVVHHIKPFEAFPDLRFEISNGLTLCQPCHFRVHGYNLRETGIIEEVDERGVTNRRWVGKCLCCGKTVVRTASDMIRKDGTHRNYAFCSHSCSAKKIQEVTREFPIQKPQDVFEEISKALSARII